MYNLDSKWTSKARLLPAVSVYLAVILKQSKEEKSICETKLFEFFECSVSCKISGQIAELRLKVRSLI